jgi:membrane-associated protease RseP (regulator of RpoE activity)
MSGMPDETDETPAIQQADFERITTIVTGEFQIEESLLEHGIPTYYLKQPQETKQAFLRLLKNLESMRLIAFLRKTGGRVVLRVVSKPVVKPSNIWINWGLFFATIATTFYTGYGLSASIAEAVPSFNPYVGGATFAIAIMAVLGLHEMGHKLTANRKGVEATPPYFIPGPPPLGTFGAVIMQKSLPPNRDALFDVGADGPVAGFVVATVVTLIGMTLAIPSPPVEATELGVPIVWNAFEWFLRGLNIVPNPPPGGLLLLHPIAFAGWVGMLVTMLNLLPAGMLDGGHVARSIVGDRLRLVLSALSILYLVVLQSYVMAFFVLFVSLARHPGPLDDVSSLSTRRKLAAVGLVLVFVLCTFWPPQLVL